MTMLAMWLGKTSVVLATDSRMLDSAGNPVKEDVPKIYVLPSDKVMFGIGFGHDEVHKWLMKCECKCNHDYVHHWRCCSGAHSIDALEQAIKKDLHKGQFPPEHHNQLTLCLAGFNEQGTLEAFVLNGAGCRVKELKPDDDVFFNETSKQAYAQVALRNDPSFRDFCDLVQGRQSKLLENKFKTLKEEKGSGAEALRETCQRLIDLCETHSIREIGGELQDYEISSLANSPFVQVRCG
jgi:hypothetical protein